jgi:hypothetical protein
MAKEIGKHLFRHHYFLFVRKAKLANFVEVTAVYTPQQGEENGKLNSSNCRREYGRSKRCRSTLNIWERQAYSNAVLCLTKLPAKTNQAIIAGAKTRYGKLVIFGKRIISLTETEMISFGPTSTRHSVFMERGTSCHGTGTTRGHLNKLSETSVTIKDGSHTGTGENLLRVNQSCFLV